MSGEADSEVRLQAILGWLEAGRITTEQAASRIRAIRFPVPAEQSIHAQRRADVNGDPEAPEPGSFFAVSHAFAEGRIDQQQYAALAEAAAASMKGQPRVSGA